MPNKDKMRIYKRCTHRLKDRYTEKEISHIVKGLSREYSGYQSGLAKLRAFLEENPAVEIQVQNNFTLVNVSGFTGVSKRNKSDRFIPKVGELIALYRSLEQQMHAIAQQTDLRVEKLYVEKA